ncbi:unnamed protein product [Camellia sinensis]
MWISWMIIAVMVGIECVEAGLNTLTKVAMTSGMSDFVFVVYSNSLALLFLLPSTLIYHRKRPSPKLTFLIVCRIFILGLLSCTAQILLYTGIGFSSPTMASAMTGLIPAFTFVLALITRKKFSASGQWIDGDILAAKTIFDTMCRRDIVSWTSIIVGMAQHGRANESLSLHDEGRFRMEKLDLKVQSSQAKSIGTIVSIVGAYIVIFYQGPPIMFSQSLPIPHSPSESPLSNWIIGGFLLATSSFVISVLYIVQTWIIKDYPAEMVVTLIACIFVAILSAIIALIVESDPKAWTLRPDVELVTIVYSAFLMVTIRSVIHIWACRTKGPVFVTTFRPLGMVFAVFMGVTFLKDTLHVGSVIGAIIIALGLYSVMWGKAKEVEIIENSFICRINSSSEEVPLLQNKSIDV